MNYPAELIEKAKKIRCVIFDVDGVLTDRKIYFSDSGEQSRAFNMFDGLSIKKLLELNVEVAVITSRRSSGVAKRLQELGIKHFYQGSEEKKAAYEKIRADLNLNDQQIAYVGDDWIDLPLIRQVGLGIIVADAEPKLMLYADWQTQKKGGEGVAREVSDLILIAQNLFEAAYGVYYL